MIRTHIERIDLSYVLCGIALLLAFLLFSSSRQPIGDFGNYYFGSLFLREGHFKLDVYDAWRFNMAIYERGYTNIFLSYTAVPPLSALIYIPFTWLELQTAKLIWNALNCALLLITLLRLSSLLDKKNRVLFLLLIPVLFFTPLRNHINSGQSYFLILFLLVEGLFAYRQRRWWLCGLCWGIAAMLKIFPLIVFGFLIFDRNWKAVGWYVASIVVLWCLSLPFISFKLWQDYLFEILPRLGRGEINNLYAQNYQSMQVLLRTLFIPDAMHNPGAPFNDVALYRILQGTFVSCLTAALIGVSWNAHISVLSKFSLWIVGGMLLSGYGTSYGLILLVLVLPVLLSEPIDRRVVYIIPVCLFLLCNMPLQWFIHLPPFLRFPRLWLMLTLFILLIIRLHPVMNRNVLHAAIIICILMLVPIRTRQANDSAYWLQKEEALLIGDFSLEKDSVLIRYFDTDGLHAKKLATPYEITSASPVPFQARGENIPKAMLVNNKEIVYLSDKGRGVGFYTLRKRSAPGSTE